MKITNTIYGVLTTCQAVSKNNTKIILLNLYYNFMKQVLKTTKIQKVGNFRACAVAKLLPAMLTSHIASGLSPSSSASSPTLSVEDGPSPWDPVTHKGRKPRASSWTNPDYCGHLGSEPSVLLPPYPILCSSAFQIILSGTHTWYV